MWHFNTRQGSATYTYVEKDEDGNVILGERDHLDRPTA